MNDETKYMVRQFILCILIAISFVVLLFIESYYNRIDNTIQTMGEDTYYDIHDLLKDKYGREPSRDEIAKYYVDHYD